MIKSDFGTIEINGIKPVVMVEFETLLVALREALGDEKYNLVLQRANDSKPYGDKTEEKKSEFEPHLVLECFGRTFNRGRIGEETNICDITGENLSVGDTVNLYAVKDDGQLSFIGERSIVKDDNSEFVMGISSGKFNMGFSNNVFKWLIILNRRHTEIEDGETVDCIKYIKSEMGDK